MVIFISLFLVGFVEKDTELSIKKIIEIESNGNPDAFNKHSQARGLMQVTPIVLIDWNNKHPHDCYIKKDLYTPSINIKIGTWYLKEEIPRLLKHYEIEDNINNRIIAYNFGIGNMVNNRKLPEETKNYIKKYWGVI